MWAYGGFNLKRNILKLLLNNCFRIYFVEIIGFEPMTSCMPCKRSSQLSYTPILEEEANIRRMVELRYWNFVIPTA